MSLHQKAKREWKSKTQLKSEASNETARDLGSKASCSCVLKLRDLLVFHGDFVRSQEWLGCQIQDENNVPWVVLILSCPFSTTCGNLLRVATTRSLRAQVPLCLITCVYFLFACRPIRSVIILVLNKLDSRWAVVRFSYYSYDYRPNNIHEKISPFWLVRRSAVFLKTCLLYTSPSPRDA